MVMFISIIYHVLTVLKPMPIAHLIKNCGINGHGVDSNAIIFTINLRLKNMYT